MFKYLQSRIRGTASTGPGAPPAGLVAFYWHFVRQTKGWYALMFVTSLAVALNDTVIPVFIGRLVSLMEAVDRKAALEAQWPLLAGMVETEKVGRVRICRLGRRRLDAEAEWIRSYADMVDARLDRLGAFLERTKGEDS